MIRKTSKAKRESRKEGLSYSFVIENLVCLTDPLVVTVPFITSNPKSFSALICQNTTMILISRKQGKFPQYQKISRDKLIVKHQNTTNLARVDQERLKPCAVAGVSRIFTTLIRWE